MVKIAGVMFVIFEDFDVFLSTFVIFEDFDVFLSTYTAFPLQVLNRNS